MQCRNRQQINRRTNPRPTPTPLPPLSKVRCCRRKNSGDYRRDCHTTHCHSTNPSKNRTISLAFRRMSVCVCLVGFASLQSTWAHTLRHPCLACSSRCTEYCHSHNNCKKTIIPRKSPTPLPPLSKVRCCRPKKFGRLPEELPHQPSPRTNPSKNRTIPLAFRRMSVCVCLVGFASLQSTWAHTLRHPCLACSSRCTEYCHSHNNCKKTIIPQKSPSHLPPLSKGGGLTARHKPLYCCFLLVPRPPFLFTKPFCRQDGGIASPPFALHHILTTPCQR